ncbi:MAG: MarR family transcriptional regulator [Chitinophagales bacterium]|nr:MarR family transcriptional regulator [Chitinophagales bacterium]
MGKFYNREIPLGRLANLITKNYLGVLSQKLNQLDMERHFYPLVLIEQGGGKITQTELSEALKTDKVSMVRILDYLSSQGMIVRQTNPIDRREHYLQVTDKAKQILPHIKQAIQEVNSAALQGFTEEQKDLFYELLGKVCCNLCSLPSEEILMEYSRVKNRPNEEKKLD